VLPPDGGPGVLIGQFAEALACKLGRPPAADIDRPMIDLSGVLSAYEQMRNISTMADQRARRSVPAGRCQC
jgi:hypothetical protein